MAFSQIDPRKSLRARCSGLRCSVRFPRRFAIAVALLATIGATPAWAAFVTLKESEMDAIFSQASFGADPIDIRYLPTITHTDTSLLNIDSSTKLYSLFGLFNSSAIHYAYFVDTVDWCGSSGTSIVGCGDMSGDDYVIESTFASGNRGAELMAHELGHNLGLGHDALPNGDNLMDSSISGSTTLTEAQANTILARPSIQSDMSGLFIEIQPVLILASVPEPSTALLAAALIGGVVCSARRWRI